MLGSGSAGNSALVSTSHCHILIDGGLSARQIVVRLEQCGVAPEQLDGLLLTHEHGDHVCGLEVLCRKFAIPIYCNSQTAEAIRCFGLGEHKNWRIFRTSGEFTICDILVQSFPVPHDAVEPVGYAFHAGNHGLGFITDLGYPTKMLIVRLREVHTLVIETNNDEKLLPSDPHRPWPVKQRLHVERRLEAAGVGRKRGVTRGGRTPPLKKSGSGTPPKPIFRPSSKFITRLSPCAFPPRNWIPSRLRAGANGFARIRQRNI